MTGLLLLCIAGDVVDAGGCWIGLVLLLLSKWLCYNC